MKGKLVTVKRYFIVGEESTLNVTETEPRIIEPGPGSVSSKYRTVLWPASSLVGGRFQFRVVRGVIEEFRAHYSGDRVYARVLPDDVLPALEDINARIAAAEDEWKRLKKEKHELLAAAAPRAEKVRIP